MLDKPQREYLKQVLRPMQIIVGALAVGVFTFMGIMLFFNPQAGGGQPNDRLYVNIGLALALLAIFASVIVPSIIAGRMRQAIADGKPIADRSTIPGSPEVGDVRPLATMYQTRLIVAAALLEGAAFFNVMAYLFERQPISLGAAAFLALMLVTKMPTLGRLQRWAESDLATLKQLRAMGSHHVR